MAARVTMTDAMIFIEVKLWRDRVTHNCQKSTEDVVPLRDHKTKAPRQNAARR